MAKGVNLLKTVLLTGASGFIGRAALDRLLGESSWRVRAAYRSLPAESPGCDVCHSPDLGPESDWKDSLRGADVVVHTAARVHMMRDSSTDPLTEFRRVNVEGTLALARQAAVAGVKRLVFVSSIKVNAESTKDRGPFEADESPSPKDPYGISKFEAELGLREIARETGMEVVIIRPPLVYGPGVKGNFANMVKVVEKGFPLPLGAIHNKRSMVALDNLVDLIITCLDHPAAANQVFLAGDGTDLSTTELLRGISKAMGKPARLIPVPAGVLMFGAGLLGKKPVAQRVLGSLQVDISKARNLLGWEPPLSVEEGLRRCFDSENEC